MGMINAAPSNRTLQRGLGRREALWNDGPDRADHGSARWIHLGASSRFAFGVCTTRRWCLTEEVVAVLEVDRLAVEPGLGKADIDAVVATELAGQRGMLPQGRRHADHRTESGEHEDEHDH